MFSLTTRSSDLATYRLLFVTPVIPDLEARDGGTRVMAQLITALASRHQVGLVAFRGDEDPRPRRPVKCEFVVELPRRSTSSLAKRWIRGARVAGGLLASRPRWAGRWWVPRHADRLRSVVETWKPDVVQFEYHITGQYAAALRHCSPARVLVEHEPGVVAAAGPLAVGAIIRRLIASADRRAWAAYERRIFHDVDRIVVFTERDRGAIRPLAGDTPILCIPFGTEVPVSPLSPTGTRAANLLFVGSFRHYPNVDGAFWLVDRIFPIVRSHCPAATLTVVGADPPAVLSVIGGPSVEVLGSVTDVRPFLDQAAVVIVPIRLGGGMRVKVVEALAAGKALVCSRQAIEGLPLRNREHVRLAETESEFAAAAIELLTNEGRRAAMAGRARAWACAHLGWDRAVAQYEALYGRLRRRQRPLLGPHEEYE